MNLSFNNVLQYFQCLVFLKCFCYGSSGRHTTVKEAVVGKVYTEYDTYTSSGHLHVHTPHLSKIDDSFTIGITFTTGL